ISIDAAVGVGSGISAADRAKTILTVIDPKSTAADLVRPGHIFPLRARKGGVLFRAGHTEGSVDLAHLPLFKSAALNCEILKDDGSMARLTELLKFSEQHQLKLVSLNDLIAYRMERECFVKETANSKLPITHLGEFTVRVFESELDNNLQHIVLQKGK